MKYSLTIGILCLTLGFGAAWLLKPGPPVETTAQPEEPPRRQAAAPAGPKSDRSPMGDPSTKSDRSESTPRIVINGEEVEPGNEEARTEMRRGRDRFREMMATRQKAKHEAQVQKLVDRLGLSEAQADQLRAYFEKNRADLAAMGEGPEDWSRIKELTGKLRGDGLEEALAGILTEEQAAAYQEMKERDRQNQVEAKALRDLAQIQGVLDLSAEQKDQVYGLLHEDASTNLEKNSDANVIVSSFTEGLGINVEPGDLGIASVIQVQIDRASDGEQPSENPADWMQVVQENRQREIDQKVERLSPVLDDQQEAAYRAHLESQGAGLLGGFIQQATEAAQDR